MTEFTLAELDEIHHAVRTYMKSKADETMAPIHRDVLRKVNEATARILDSQGG